VSSTRETNRVTYYAISVSVVVASTNKQEARGNTCSCRPGPGSRDSQTPAEDGNQLLCDANDALQNSEQVTPGTDTHRQK